MDLVLGTRYVKLELKTTTPLDSRVEDWPDKSSD
jgi:hypothetical protein